MSANAAPPAPTGNSDTSDEIQVGSLVILKDLVRRQDLDGKWGQVIAPANEKKRWGVVVHYRDQERIYVKHENMELNPEVKF